MSRSFLKPGRNAGDGVGHQRARQAMQRALVFGIALGDERAVFLLEVNPLGQRPRHLALGTLHFHGIGLI
jgi:hypothetical protein